MLTERCAGGPRTAAGRGAEALPYGSFLGPPEAVCAAVAALPARLSGDFGCAVVALGGQDTLDPGVMAEVLATLAEGCLVLVAADDRDARARLKAAILALTNPP